MKKKAEIPPQFGENLAMYRARCGITLKKLAKLTGQISQLKKWERSLVLPSLQKMWLISRELGQPIENFFNTFEIPYRKSNQKIDLQSLGKKIKSQRTKEKEMSQIKLAALLSVEWSTVSNWERGRQYPTLLNILQLGKVFNCRIDDLIE